MEFSFEIEKNKINFTHLWKIKMIDVNVVTFEKYEVHPECSISDSVNKSKITLKDFIGTEIHKVSPEVQIELSGKVGEVIKDFELSKVGGTIRVKKIIWL